MPPQKKRNVTLNDVALAANVSRTAAAKVLLGTGGDHVRIGKEAQERVQAAAKRLNYRPNRAAQLLAGAKTHTFGVLMDTLNAPIMNDRLAAIEKEASCHGYRLLIGQVHGDNDILSDYLFEFNSRGADAILCLFDLTRGREERLLPLLGNSDNIIMHAKSLNKNSYCVRVDTSQAITDIIHHLSTSGYKRIGLQLENLDDEFMTLRRNAYIDAMQSLNHQIDHNIIWTATDKTTMPSPKTLQDCVTHLVAQQQVDAIVAANDLWAVRLIQHLKSEGYRIPQDVAVSGYDNLSIATIIDPPLTTIDQQHALYAKAAVKLMISMASGIRPQHKTITIQPKLIVRESTARN